MKYIQKISVSVIVPVYNVEKYLRDCLESLLYQTESFDEIVLVMMVRLMTVGKYVKSIVSKTVT